MTNSKTRRFIPAMALAGAIMSTSLVNVFAVSEPTKEISLTIDGEERAIKSSYEKTVAELLEKNGFKYKEKDNINYELNSKILDNMAIVVTSQKTISLSERGVKSETQTKALTVEDFLKEKKIELSEDDVVIPSLETKLKAQDEIAIIYHKESVYDKKIDLDFSTKKEFSFDVPFGEEKVVQKGEKGLKVQSFKKITRNAITLSNEMILEKTEKDPVQEIIAVGTKETVNEDIPFSTTIEKDSTLYEGETKVVSKGVNGVKKKIYENKEGNKNFVSEEIVSQPQNKVIKEGTKKKPSGHVGGNSVKVNSGNSSAQYSLSQFKRKGVVHNSGKKFTYYSQSVLPGGGLRIPGRHVSNTGYVSDKDGFIVLASSRSISKGTVIDTPFGAKGKVYDICASCSPEWFDVYIK